MNKVPLALLLGTIILLLAFGMVALRVNQIRDRLVLPYMAEKAFTLPLDKIQVIKNHDDTESSVLAYYNDAIASEMTTGKNAALFFPNELIQIDAQTNTLLALRQSHALVMVPLYRGVISAKTSWPTEKLLYDDSLAAKEFIEAAGYTIDYVGGDRLGAAVAAYVASTTPVANLVLYNPWTKTSDVFAKAPLLALLKIFRWDEFDTSAALAQTKAAAVTFVQANPADNDAAATISILQKSLPAGVLSKDTVADTSSGTTAS